MTETKNIIKKMVVEIDSNSMKEALMIKDNIDSFLKIYLYPKLNDIFNSETLKDQYLQFEKLDVDLLTSDVSDWNSNSDQISKKIIAEIREKSSVRLIPNKEKNKALNNNIIVSKTVKTFFYFLSHGQLPWWNRIPKKHLEEEVISSIKKEDFIAFDNNIINKSINLYRLVFQFDNQFITKLYLKFLDKPKTNVKSYFDIPAVLKTHYYKKSFWEFAFSVIPLRKNKPEKILKLFEKFIVETLFTTSKSMLVFKASVKEKNQLFKLLTFLNNELHIPITIIPATTLSNGYQFHYSNEISKLNLIKKFFNQDSFQLLLKEQNWVIHAEKRKGQAKNGESSNKNEEQTLSSNLLLFKKTLNAELFEDGLSDEIKNDGLIVKQAGLILLHPFLKAFFDKLKFLEKGKLIPSKKEAAIHILHYLATGNEKAWEHELIFEKFLCDVPISQPINRFIVINKQEKKSCNELLRAVLSHWKSIKTENTQVVQNEFFQREGKLSFQNDKVVLTIPRKTQDILLDSLPWNIHMVKIPWKEKLLFVNW